ncbi:MAG: folylpolyglutamate synthase/dihydrofolate synthase family protein [Chitinophagales bacterium]
MSYQETLDFLYSQLPMYSRIGKAAYKADLNNTLQLCGLLGHPEKEFKSIHVAGTNGKGSVSHMLAAILQSAGYKTGLYTSPHLKDFRERIRINGKMIQEAGIIEFVENHHHEVTRIGCSFFEWTVGLAFNHFARHKVDIAVIETGMGGRLDSTNVITPLLSIITNISADHTDILGETLIKIAAEKAGIIKKKIPVVIGETDELTKSIFENYALEKNADIYFADQFFKVTSATSPAITMGKNYKLTMVINELIRNKEFKLVSDLCGYYQKKNMATVFQSVAVLNEIGLQIPYRKMIKALSSVKKLTGLRGRWDILSENPVVIADVAHNEAGLKFSIDQLSDYPFALLHMVLGFVREKDLSKILPILPKHARYYFCSPDIERRLDANTLLTMAKEYQLDGEAFPSVKIALESAKCKAARNDVIYIGGSTFVVAEVI